MVFDLNLDEMQVGDLPGFGDGLASHPASLSPVPDKIGISSGGDVSPRLRRKGNNA
jgi:hypothetical protein